MNRRTLITSLSITLLLLSVTTRSVGAHWEFHDLYGQYLFGYTGVEGNIPLYRDEIAANGIRTNVTTISSPITNTNLSGPISFFNSRGDKAALFMDNVIFIEDPNVPKCNPPYNGWRLRLDYQAKIDAWISLNSAYLTPDRVAFLIINGEANNRCLTAPGLDQATAYVKSRLPALPTVVGYGLTGNRTVTAPLPSQPAGFAFWTYGSRYPNDPGSAFQYWLNFFKQQIGNGPQRLIVVFDAHHQPYHTSLGISPEVIGPMATRYADVVLSEPKIVGMIGFTWASFGDHIGMRDLPQSVRDRNRTVSCRLLPC